ncbi:MAG: four helix bundle protein [Kiritimatiellae bacterium]|nr:four helix bundle protein [Kiritimatiellia bacterium]
MKTDNPIAAKSKAFAVAAVRACQRIRAEKSEYVLSKQFVRSATSIGANVHEALRAQSRPDFLAKMSIALKEAQETEYWLDLLHETDYLAPPAFASLQAMNAELLRLLMSICKTTSSSPSPR